MRIGVYIGSFNPPHLGHKKIIDFIIQHKYVDKVLIVPTPNYWNKNNLVDIKDRLNMLNYYEDDHVTVDTKNNHFPYTYQLLASIKKECPKDELYLVIGSDNLSQLHKWKNVNEILKYKVIVLSRGKKVRNQYINDSNFIYIDDFDFINISSTEIRKGNFKYLDSKIKEYIINNHLYEEE